MKLFTITQTRQEAISESNILLNEKGYIIYDNIEDFVLIKQNEQEYNYVEIDRNTNYNELYDTFIGETFLMFDKGGE